MANYCHSSIDLHGPAEQIQQLIDAITVAPDEYDITIIQPVPEPLLEIDSEFMDSPEPHQNWDVMLDKGQISRERYDFLCDRQRKEYAIAQKNLAEYGHKTWYSWTKQHWGTKWVRTDEISHKTGDEIAFIQTVSAWSPPTKLAQYINEAYPDIDVTITYREEGAGFAGGAIYIDGKTAHEEEHDFHDNDLPNGISTKRDQLEATLPTDDDNIYVKLANLQGEFIDTIYQQVWKTYNDIKTIA